MRRCGAIFNLHSRPSSRGERCENDGGVLVQREDDTEAVIRRRLTEFDLLVRAAGRVLQQGELPPHRRGSRYGSGFSSAAFDHGTVGSSRCSLRPPLQFAKLALDLAPVVCNKVGKIFRHRKHIVSQPDGGTSRRFDRRGCRLHGRQSSTKRSDRARARPRRAAARNGEGLRHWQRSSGCVGADVRSCDRNTVTTASHSRKRRCTASI